ncbi:DNA-3-methyladenine glycosylase I [Aurantimonas sp. Leaf443]|uniref:DNA-3-methyladenine glycosylase I n=1 Tax=Aurantimonas sp. Leaf443 TaxID=1736378 RepID=UPI00070077A6|nr:DNA-3-methyladenine glycosylase I [Aurantimonas sp. Leaf443]KQT87957.1 3-methyladenine DNA glycosylase [Aurantimonas sp. Leaf443]
MSDDPALPDPAAAPGLALSPDGRHRCAWGEGSELYRAYHDAEWGRPSGDDDRLFEKLCLEGFQAGLSWITILRKREAFRERFHGFAVSRVAAMDEADVERIVADARIVRHRAKIVSALNNARRVEALRQETGASFAAFLWAHEPPAAERPATVTGAWMRANPVTPASARLSKALKGRGFSFVGPTTVYAFLQSMGFVNDHIEGCCARGPCEAARARFVRPR